MSKKPLVVIFLTVFIDLVGFGIIIPLSPFLAREYGADEFQIGLLMAVYSLMQFLFSPFWGGLSDRFGRRPIILLSLFGSVLAHGVFAFADSFLILFLSRMFAGLCGANISTAMAYIADVTDESGRSKGMGLIGAAFGLGFLLGPVIGGVFGHLGEFLGSGPPFGPHFSALAASGICLFNLILAFFVLKESLVIEDRVDIKKREKKPSRLGRVYTALNTPVMGKLIGVFFLSGLGMAFMETTLFMYVDDKFGWNYKMASYGFAYVGLILVFTQGYLIRRWIPRFGEKKLMVGGLFLATVGMVLIGAALEIWHLAIAVTCLGFGVGLLNPAITGSISLLASQGNQGATMGVTQSLSALARIIGPPLGGVVYRDVGVALPFYLSGLAMALGMMIVISIFKSVPEKGKEA